MTETTIITIQWLGSKGSFWTGVALASPFVSDIVAWKFAAVLFIPWALSLITRPNLPRAPSLFMWLIAALVTAHFIALIVAPSQFASAMWRDTLIAAALLFIAASTIGNTNGNDLLDGFFAIVKALALVTAIIGLTKLALQDRGFLLGIIIHVCPGQYPQGTNLCTDYNMLGMLWLVGAVGFISERLKRRTLMPLLFLVIVISAGLAVGSRRFLILVTLLPFIWLALAWRMNRKQTGLEVGTIVLASLSSIAAFSIIQDPDRSERFLAGLETYTIIGRQEIGRPEGPQSLDFRPPNRAYPDVIASTIDEGFGSRFERWTLAINLFASRPWFGYGFLYHKHYVANNIRDYPHLPVLTEGLIGGAFLLLIALGCYVALMLNVLLAPFALHATGITTVVVFVTAVTAISGDTLFSIPQWLAVAMVFVSTDLRPENSSKIG